MVYTGSKPIGGYFSLELPLYEEFHKDAIKLNTGRNCLEYILRVRRYRKVYIPYYTCEVILEPFHKLNIPYEFYHINYRMELTQDIKLKNNEALLYTNCFGLKQRYLEQLAQRYRNSLIVDNTQAFYAKPIEGIDTFYTCRKFFGVPDGAYLYTDQSMGMELEQDLSFNRMISLTKRIDLSPEAGYLDFRDASKALIAQPIKRMSKLTQRMMCGIDYSEKANRRIRNFHVLDKALRDTNRFKWDMGEGTVPLVYPYYVENGAALRQHLIDHQVFCARYWPNVLEWCQPDDWEYQLAENLVCLPVDQRYDKEDMKIILDLFGSFK